MQGKQNAIGSQPETLGFNYGSTSSDGGIDQQICWNNLRNPAPNRLPDCMVSSNDTNIQFFNPMSQERQNIIGWSLGESSSSGAQNHAIQGEQKTDNGWSSALTTRAGPSHFCEKQQYGSSDILSLSNVEVNGNINQIANNTSFSRGSNSSSIPHDLKRNSGFEGQDDDCEVMECTPAYKSSGPGKERMPASTSSDLFAGPSGTNGYLMDVGDGRLNCSLDGRRLSCKRKTLEGHLVQSSGSGSLNYIPLPENSLCHSVPAPHNLATGANRSAPTESSRNINFSEQVNPRLGLTMGRATRETPGLPASRSAESSNRNFRVRINGSHQQDSTPCNLFPGVGDVGNVNLSSERHSSRVLRNSSLDLRSVFAADDGNPQMQPVVPSLRRSAQARLNLASSSRAGSSMSSSSFSLSGYRNSATCEEPNSRSLPRSISQHPMFIPSTDGRSLNQNPANWNVAGRAVAGNVASISRSSSSSGAHSSSPTLVPHRNHPQFPRRLPQFVRRALSSSAGTEPVGHTGNSPPLHLSSAASQETAFSGNHGHRSSTSRSAMVLERHLDSAIGVPYSWRTSAAASEGRSRLVSEIRNVLDRMRRGEGLRFEDVMILDQSVFLGMTDIHDRHRDMRLDVDNMTYEELLALEERIGNVCTGLSEETICSQLKQQKYISRTEEPMDAEPCSICQEEYKDGVDLGTLSCGHDFHRDCIKQWLTHKNLCPICKTTGLTT